MRRRIARTLAALLGLVLAGAPTVCAKKKPPAKPVNINMANSEELQQVPGIGPVTAEKIIQMRKSYGSFKSVDDLLAIKGIGKKRLDKMRKYLTVGKAAAPKMPQPSATPSSVRQKPETKLQERFLPTGVGTRAPLRPLVAPQELSEHGKPASLEMTNI